MKLNEIEFKDIDYTVFKAPDDVSPESMIMFHAPPLIDGMGMILVFLSDREVSASLIGIPPTSTQSEGEEFCKMFITALNSDEETEE